MKVFTERGSKLLEMTQIMNVSFGEFRKLFWRYSDSDEISRNSIIKLYVFICFVKTTVKPFGKTRQMFKIVLYVAIQIPCFEDTLELRMNFGLQTITTCFFSLFQWKNRNHFLGNQDILIIVSTESVSSVKKFVRKIT